MNILQYLFTPIPGSHFGYYIPMLVVAALLLIGGEFLKKMCTKNKALKRTVKKIPSYLSWGGILLALALALRYERIPYFSMRFLFIILLILILIAIAKGVHLYIKNYENELRKTETHKETKKVYLPHKNRR